VRFDEVSGQFARFHLDITFPGYDTYTHDSVIPDERGIVDVSVLSSQLKRMVKGRLTVGDQPALNGTLEMQGNDYTGTTNLNPLRPGEFEFHDVPGDIEQATLV